MKMPVLFVGHGSPLNAIEQNAFTLCLRDLRPKLPTPTAVAVVSAHWVTQGCQVLGAARPRTIHDFYGFPRPLYKIDYPAPGAPDLAKRLAIEHHLAVDHEWGLDHGAWSVLRHLYPEAHIPVFQISLDHARTLPEHLALGAELKKLRERGVLLLGSGNLVHNLHQINWEMPHSGYPWALEFDSEVRQAIDDRNAEALSAPDRWSNHLLGQAHPTLEHYVPLLYCLGASDKTDQITYPYEGMEFGTISMRMVLFS